MRAVPGLTDDSTLAGSRPLLGYTHFFALRAIEGELVLPGTPGDVNVLIPASCHRLSA